MSFFEEGVVVLGSYESNLLLGRFCVLLVVCRGECERDEIRCGGVIRVDGMAGENMVLLEVCKC